MDRKKLLQSPDYWIAQLQLEIFWLLDKCLKDNNISVKELSEKTGISEKMFNQINSGDFDGKLSDLVSIALKLRYVPSISFKPLEEIS